MQDVYTFAGTDQCHLQEYGPYSYICKSRTICFELIHCSNDYDKFAQRNLLLSSLYNDQNDRVVKMKKVMSS